MNHSPKISRRYNWAELEHSATITCSCGWSHTIVDENPIPPPTLYRIHKQHRETM